MLKERELFLKRHPENQANGALSWADISLRQRL